MGIQPKILDKESMRTQRELETVIEAHVPHALRLARSLAWRQQVSSAVEREDMCADALLGLVQAARSYHAELGVPFWAYAQLRVAGAVRNGLQSRRGRLRTVPLAVAGQCG